MLLGAMNRAPTRLLGEVGLGTAAFSRVVDEVGGEMKDALEGVEGDVVVGLGLADTRCEDEAELAGAGFFVGVHGIDDFLGRDVGPWGERGQAAD